MKLANLKGNEINENFPTKLGTQNMFTYETCENSYFTIYAWFICAYLH